MSLTLENGLDIFVLLVMALAVWRGWVQGLVMKAAQLGAVIAACIIAGAAASLLSEKLGRGILLSSFDENALLSGAVGEEIASVANNLAWGIVYTVSFLIAILVLRHLIKILNLVDRIPVIGTLNRLGGAIVGFVVAFVLLYALCGLVLRMFPQTTVDEWGLTEEVIAHTYIFRVFASR